MYSEAQIEILMEILRNTVCPRESTMAQALLLRSEGWTLEEVAEEFGCKRAQIGRYQRKFLAILAERDKGTEPVDSPAAPETTPNLSEDALASQSPPVSPDQTPASESKVPPKGPALDLYMKSFIARSQTYTRPYDGRDIRRVLEERGLKRSLSWVYKTLKRLKFSYQTTRPRNPLQNAAERAQWEKDFPNVLENEKQKHPDKDVHVYCGDETRYGQKGILRRQWAPKGQRPVRPRQDGFENAYIYGAGCPKNGKSHFLVAQNVDSDWTQMFLDGLSSSLQENVHALLILDNASYHKSARLKIPSNITIHHLPPYCPELNPIENLWGFMKRNFLCNKVYGNIGEILDHGVKVCGQVTKEHIMSVCHRNSYVT